MPRTCFRGSSKLRRKRNGASGAGARGGASASAGSGFVLFEAVVLIAALAVFSGTLYSLLGTLYGRVEAGEAAYSAWKREKTRLIEEEMRLFRRTGPGDARLRGDDEPKAR